MIKFTATLKTTGKGLWSDVAKEIKLTGLDVSYSSDDGDYGELRVYFDTATWDIERHGFVYTDEGFLNDLRIYLCVLGFPGSEVHYSEQGMQGDDYISFDVGSAFVKTFKEATAA